jgi:hypothetical protein
VEAALAGAVARVVGVGDTVAADRHEAVAAGTAGGLVGDGYTAAVQRGALDSAVYGVRAAAAEVLAAHTEVLGGAPLGS